MYNMLSLLKSYCCCYYWYYLLLVLHFLFKGVLLYLIHIRSDSQRGTLWTDAAYKQDDLSVTRPTSSKLLIYYVLVKHTGMVKYDVFNRYFLPVRLFC